MNLEPLFFLISKMFQLVTIVRHTGMAAGLIRRERICINPEGVQSRIALHESSHRDVKLFLAPRLVMPQRFGKLPSMALDTGIHAGMTVLAEVPC
jgi:hypothetical protein